VAVIYFFWFVLPPPSSSCRKRGAIRLRQHNFLHKKLKNGVLAATTRATKRTVILLKHFLLKKTIFLNVINKVFQIA
jgi:hypothetical protein